MKTHLPLYLPAKPAPRLIQTPAPLWLALVLWLTALHAQAQVTTFTTTAPGGGQWHQVTWVKSGAATDATYPGEGGSPGQHRVVISLAAGDTLRLSTALSAPVTGMTIEGGTLRIESGHELAMTSPGHIDAGAGALRLQSSATLSTPGNVTLGKLRGPGGLLHVSGGNLSIADATTGPFLLVRLSGPTAQNLSVTGRIGALTVDAGATVSTAGGFTIDGQVNSSGSLTATGPLTWAGQNMVLAATSQTTLASLNCSRSTTKFINGSLTVQGDLTSSGGGALSHGNGRITFNSGGLQTINGPSAVSLFNVTVGPAAGTVLRLAQTISVTGTATGQAADGSNAALGIGPDARLEMVTHGINMSGDFATLVTGAITSLVPGTGQVTFNNNITIARPTQLHSFLIGANRTLTVRSKLRMSGAGGFNTGSRIIHESDTLILHGATVAFGALAAQDTSQIANLRIESAGQKHIHSPVRIPGHFWVRSGSGLTLNRGTILLSGHWDGDGNVSHSATSTLIMEGGADQEIRGAIIPFNNVWVRKTGGAVLMRTRLALSSPATTQLGPNQILDLGTTTGHALGMVTGRGRLRISALAGGTTAFPSGTFTGFLSPGSTGTVEYNGATSYTVSNISSLTFHHLVFSGGGTRTLGQAAVADGDVTIETGTTLDGGSVALTIRQGDLTNRGTLNGSTGNVLFSSTTRNQTIGGPGVYNLSALRLQKSGFVLLAGNDLNVSTRVNLETNGVLDMGPHTLTLGPAAAILTQTSFSAACMVRLEAGTGRIVKQATTAGGFINPGTLNIVNDNQQYFPVGTGTLFTPVLLTALSATVGAGGEMAVRLEPFTTADNHILRRYWHISTQQITAVTDARLTFRYLSSEVVGTPNTVVIRQGGTDYVANGSFFDGISVFGVDGPGNTRLAGRWSFGRPDLSITYYTRQSGNFTDRNTWTTDFTGNSYIGQPDVGGPDANDKIVILPGRTVTFDRNTIIVDSVHITGTGIVNLGTTTGHDLKFINGDGTLRLSSGSLPQARFSWPSSLTRGGQGTIVYHNWTGTVSDTMRRYHHLTFEGTGTKTLQASTGRNLYEVTGRLRVLAGTLTLHSTTAAHDLTLSDEVTIESGGTWNVSTANFEHQIRFHAGVINRGTLRLTALAAPVQNSYYTSVATVGRSRVQFIGSGNRQLQAIGQTDLHIMEVIMTSPSLDTLTVIASRPSRFALYGNNDQAEVTLNTAVAAGQKALRLTRGWLVLTDSVMIPSLTSAGDWRGSTEAGMILRGGRIRITHVTTPGTYGMAVNSDLILERASRLESGPGGWGLVLARGTIRIESGLIDIAQVVPFRSASFSTSSTAWVMNGGVTHVGRTGHTLTDFPRFVLGHTQNSWQQRGGALHLYNPVSSSRTSRGGLVINANTNMTITGGSIYCHLPVSSDPLMDFGISLRPSIWNLRIVASQGTTTRNVWVGRIDWWTGHWGQNSSTNYDPANLTVRRSILVYSGAGLDVGSKRTLFGDSCAFYAGSRYERSTGVFQMGTNISGIDQATLHLYTEIDLSMNQFVVDANPDTRPFHVNGTGSITATSYSLWGGPFNLNTLLTVTGLADVNNTIQGTGRMILSGTATSDLTGNNSGYIHRLEIAKTGGAHVQLQAPTRTNDLTLTSGVIDVGAQELRVSMSITMTAAGINNCVRTSAGGSLRRDLPTGAQTLLYPVATAGKYRPLTLSYTGNTPTDRWVSVSPRDGAHPNITAPGTADSVLNYWWRINRGGSTAALALSYSASYQDADFPASNPTHRDDDYVIGRYYYGLVPPVWQTSAHTGHATNTLAYTGGAPEVVDLTVGRIIAFGGEIVFFSRIAGDWDAPATWQRRMNNVPLEAISPTVPAADNPVVIAHAVRVRPVSGQIVVRRLQFDNGSDLDLGTTLSTHAHNFGQIVHNGTAILRLSSSGPLGVFPAGNWSDFLTCGGPTSTVVWYSSGVRYRIPAQPAGYQSLNIHAVSGSILIPDIDLLVCSNMSLPNTAAADTLILAPGNRLTVNNDISLSANNRVFFPAGGLTELVARRHVTNAGRITAAATGAQPVFFIGSNLTQDGILDLAPGGPTGTMGVLRSNEGVSGTWAGSGTLNRVGQILIEKNATNQRLTLSLNALELMAPTQPGGGQGLFITQGGLTWNVPGTHLIQNAHNQAAPLRINSGATFIIDRGTLEARSTGTNAHFALGGLLRLMPGTSFKLLSDATTDSYIEILSSSSNTIDMRGDSLVVGGQIRSATSAQSWTYNQQSGVVLVGARNALAPSRPMFELPSGSNATVSAGQLIIARSTNRAAGQPDVQIQPTSTISITGGELILGTPTTPTGQTFNVAAPLLGNLTVRTSPAAQRPRVTMLTPLTLVRHLTLETGTELNLGGQTLELGGNLTAQGTLPAANTGRIRLVGAGVDQVITGPGLTALDELTYAPTLPTSQLTLSTGGPILNRQSLFILQGTVQAGGTELTVRGDVTCLGSINNSSTGAMILAGTTGIQTITTGLTSSFGGITINNTAGVRARGNIAMTRHLTLQQGMLDMDTLSLFLSDQSNILGTGLGSARAIRTAGTLTDGGITKALAPGAHDLTLPLAVGPSAPFIYVPVRFQVTANTAPGTVTVKPVNGPHPATSGSANQEMAFYWSVRQSGFAGLSVTHTYQYNQAQHVNGRGLESNYIAARYTGGIWMLGEGDVLPVPDQIRYASRPIFEGDYTAGEALEFSNAGTFVSNGTGGGPWEVGSSWLGGLVPTPMAPVHIRLSDVITVTGGAKLQSITTLDADARLDLGTTQGHALGTLFGQGTLALEGNILPSGNYGAFTSAGGGTIEYRGAGYTISASRSVYNNLRIAASTGGTLDMAPLATTLNGNLTIASGTFRNLSNKKLIVRGHLYNQARFIAGSLTTNENLELLGDLINEGPFEPGNTITVFRGFGGQTIGGTVEPVFSSLQINKPSGHLSLRQGAAVTRQITLTQGNIKLHASTLRLMDTTLVRPEVLSPLSYIEAQKTGRLIKQLTGLPTPMARINAELYPVGDSISYTPARIQVLSGTLSGPVRQIGVSVRRQPHPQQMQANRFLARYWALSSEGLTNVLANISYQYAHPSEIVDNYPADPRPLAPSRFVGGTWTTATPGYDPDNLIFSWAGANTFGDYTAGTGQGDLTPLPVTLASFRGAPTREGIRLDWATATEKGVGSFAVERAHPALASSDEPDAMPFFELARIASRAPQGTSLVRLTYTHLDAAPRPGVNYYRLRTRDLDGTEALSPLVTVTWLTAGPAETITLRAVPNPTPRGKLVLHLTGAVPGQAQLTITDLQGRSHYQAPIGVSGTSGQRIDLSGKAILSPGTYLVTIHGAGEPVTTRLMVQP